MGRQSKIEQMLELFEADNQERCENGPSYPEDIQIVAGHIVVAGLDDNNNPSLQVYDPEYLNYWYPLVMANKRDFPDEEAGFWLWEAAAELDACLKKQKEKASGVAA